MNDRQQWLADRRTGIGGSDVAAILGLSPWVTPFQLYLDKTGRAPDVEPPPDQAERMYWGTVLEDVVARHAGHALNAKVQRVNKMLRHPEVACAIANIDRAIVTPSSVARWDDKEGKLKGADAILECKTAGAFARTGGDWGEPGTANVPPHYFLQCQWYAGIAGVPRVDLAVLFGGQKFGLYVVEFDAALFNDTLAEVDAWWRRHVVADMPPDPNGEQDARLRWAKHVAGKQAEVTERVAQAVADLRNVKAQIAALEEHEKALRDVILPAFGDAESIAAGGSPIATWKANKDSSKTDWRALAEAMHPTPELVAMHTTTIPGSRVLRLITPKEQQQ